MRQILNSFIEELYQKQNTGSRPWQNNLFLKADYEHLLEPAYKVISQNPDLSLEELRELLFKEYQVESKIATFLTKQKLADSLSVTYGNKNITESISYGTLESGNIVTEDTLFDIASTTKMFTMLCILKLVDTGLLRLDDEIGDIYDDVDKFPKIYSLTILDLLTFHPLVTDGRIDTASSLDEALYRLNNIRIKDEFTGTSKYTDMTAMVLRDVIEHVTNMNYETFLREYVLKDLQIENTYINVPESKIVNTSSTNNAYIIGKDGSIILRDDIKTGVPFDPKAKFLLEKGNLASGHAGVFSTSRDLSKVANGLFEKKILSDKLISQIGVDYTGFVDSENNILLNSLGMLVYSKRPDGNTEVPHFLSGQAFASPGYNGSTFILDPLNQNFMALVSNKPHNHVVSSPSEFIKVDENKMEYAVINGQVVPCSRRFAWEKDAIISSVYSLVLAYDFLDKVYNVNEKSYVRRRID